MSEICSFFKTFLEMEGAVTEPADPDGLDVIAPPALQKSLEIPEMISLGFGAESPEGAHVVTLESDWMERVEKTIDTRGRSSRIILNTTADAPSPPERVLEQMMVLNNATFRFSKVVPAWTRYWIVTLCYTAISDEKREGMLNLGINLSNGGIVETHLKEMIGKIMESDFQMEQNLPDDIQLPGLWKNTRLQHMLQQSSPVLVHHQLDKFLNSMRQRQERDLARVFEYHLSLRDESIRQLALLKQKNSLTERQQSDQKRHQQRLETITREHRAKIQDIRQKYDISIECRMEQMLELVMPVQRFQFIILRRKGKRSVSLDWNPLIRKLDQPPCDYGYHKGPQRSVCDDRLHLLPPEGYAACIQCDKVFCRACDPQCPKCKK
ncbi:MAG: hypothetical protein HQM14_02360 [SAR324 cluster bacterium]|nr:hypothetical protein [SAR324 cluster bacterium]